MKYLLSFLFICFLSGNSVAQVLASNDFEAKLKDSPNAQLIDVRTTGEYGGGHLPKAQNIDYRSADFKAKASVLDKSKPVFVYCLSGGRSKAAAEILRAEGYTVYDLQGGWLKWSAALKPTEGTKADDKAVGLTPEAVQKIINGNDIVVIDFFAPWCAPCMKMLPTVDKLSAELEGKVKFIKLDADANKAVMEAYHVDEIPTFMIYKKGVLSMRAIGVQDEKSFRSMILD
jgi:thioredoxin 1